MSDAEQPADTGTTDAQHGDDQQREELDWTETQARFTKRQEERRELAVDFGDAVAWFTVRGLDDEQQREAERAAVSSGRKGQRRGGDPDLSDIDTAAVKDTILKHGITEGPDGFKPHREDHRKQLAPGVKDQLVEEIEELSSLDVVEREQFP